MNKKYRKLSKRETRRDAYLEQHITTWGLRIVREMDFFLIFKTFVFRFFISVLNRFSFKIDYPFKIEREKRIKFLFKYSNLSSSLNKKFMSF